MYIRCTIDVILTLLRAIRPAATVLIPSVVVATAVAIPVVAATLGAIFGTHHSKAFAVIVAAISV